MITIPLQLLNLHDDGFHLLVEVVVFGQNFKAVLDTGASKTVFDKGLITELTSDENLLVLTEHLSTGLGTTSMESFTVLIPDLYIGELHLPDFTAAVIDLSSINYAYEKMDIDRIAGVIGGDILMQYRGRIDYGNLTLKLSTRRLRR